MASACVRRVYGARTSSRRHAMHAGRADLRTCRHARSGPAAPRDPAAWGYPQGFPRRAPRAGARSPIVLPDLARLRGLELLDPLSAVDFARIHVPLRIDRNLMDPVEFTGLAAIVAERAQHL